MRAGGSGRERDLESREEQERDERRDDKAGGRVEGIGACVCVGGGVLKPKREADGSVGRGGRQKRKVETELLMAFRRLIF